MALRIYHNLIRYKRVEDLTYYQVKGTANNDAPSFNFYDYKWNNYCLVNGERVDLCKYQIGESVFYGDWGGTTYFEFQGDIIDIDPIWDSTESQYYYIDDSNNKVYIGESACYKVFDSNGTITPINNIHEYVSNIEPTISFNVTFVDLDTNETNDEVVYATINSNNEWSFQYPKTKKIQSFSHEESSGSGSGSGESENSLISIDFSDADNFSEFITGNWMFNGNSLLESIDFSNQNFSNMTSAHSMFNGCKNLVNGIRWSSNNNFNSLEDASYMFSGCIVGLTEISLIKNASNLDTNIGDADLSFFVNDFYYKIINNNDVEIFDNNLDEDTLSLVIPQYVTIGTFTFNVTTIGNYAFKYLSNLTSLDIGNVKYIGSYSFNNSHSLQEINLRKIESLGSGVFNTNNISKVDIYDINYYYQVIADDFEWTENKWDLYLNGTKATNLNLSISSLYVDNRFKNCNSVYSITLSNATTIQVYAFYGCSNLTSIDLSNVTTIDDYAFYGCSNLTSIDLSNVTTIGNYAFYICDNLTSINLSHLTSIGDYAFYGCEIQNITLPSLTSLNLKKAEIQFIYNHIHYIITNYNTVGLFKVDNGYFNGTFQIPEYCNIDNKTFIVESIYQNNVFENCSTITSLSYNDNILLRMGILNEHSSVYNPYGEYNIGMFKNCSNLISISPTLKYYNSSYSSFESMFEGCTSINDSNIGSVLNTNYTFSTKSTKNMFKNVQSLMNFNLKLRPYYSSSPQILNCHGINGESMFENCTYLSNVIFSETISFEKMNNMFKNCANLISFNVDKIHTPFNFTISLDKMFTFETECYGLFYGCEKLETITINAIKDEINGGYYSDYANFYLKLNFDENTFKDCYSLNEIKLEGDIKLNGNLFLEDSPLLGVETIEDLCGHLSRVENESIVKFNYTAWNRLDNKAFFEEMIESKGWTLYII